MRFSAALFTTILLCNSQTHLVPTVHTTAEDLRPEADGAVGVPGLRVDPDVTGDTGDGEESEHRGFWILVPFKYLNNLM